MKKLLLLSLITILFFGCSPSNNDDEPNQEISLPQLTSTSVSSITQVSAESGGTVTDDGGATITARGVCWSTTSNPTITSDKTIDGTGVGSYTSSLTDLTMNTTYYVRAYATNSQGTAYGNEVSFTTSPELVYNGNINLTTQQEVEDFGSNGYNRVTGGIDIYGNTINDLSSLKDLKNIDEGLYIRETLLNNFEGLENLVSIGGLLNIYDNNSLASVEGLNSLVDSDGLRFFNNDVLVDISALESLVTVTGSLTIIGNDALTNTVGLHNIITIGKSLIVSENPLLASLDLDNLTEVDLAHSWISIQIRENNSLVDINLSELINVWDSVEIEYNESLTNLSKLNKLRYVGYSLIISNNPNLTSMPFENLVTIDGYLSIHSNDAIIDFDGLSSLTSVRYDFKIEGNSSNFLSISGLGSLETIGGDAIIVGTLAENLNAFKELTTVGGNFSVSNNDSLENLEGLNKLSSVGGRFWITNNDSLLNVDGLEALVSTGVDTYVGGIGFSLDIVNNNSLLNLNGLTNFVNAADGAGALSIYNNDVLTDFCGLQAIFTGEKYSFYDISNNSYNPTAQDIIDGNCSQ